MDASKLSGLDAEPNVEVTSLFALIEQCMADSKRWFPDVSEDAFFTALAMCGETGEVANILKKVARGSYTLEQVREEVAEECVDVLIYLCMMFGILGLDPMTIYNRKRDFNEQRFGSRRNVHCSNCGDTRGGPFGHETSECTHRSNGPDDAKHTAGATRGSSDS